MAAFFLDTNVISELMRPAPAPAVLDWFGTRRAADLHLPAIVEAELRYGIALLPEGRRRDGLAAAVEAMVEEDFRGRVAPFDSAAAKAYARIAADRRAAGLSVREADCQIAAIALARGGIVATRNLGDFEGAGVEVVNPWTDAA